MNDPNGSYYASMGRDQLIRTLAGKDAEIATLKEALRQSKCRHKWEAHTDSEPTSAGMQIESFDKCTKCGLIR